MINLDYAREILEKIFAGRNKKNAFLDTPHGDAFYDTPHGDAFYDGTTSWNFL